MWSLYHIQFWKAPCGKNLAAVLKKKDFPVRFADRELMKAWENDFGQRCLRRSEWFDGREAQPRDRSYMRNLTVFPNLVYPSLLPLYRQFSSVPGANPSLSQTSLVLSKRSTADLIPPSSQGSLPNQPASSVFQTPTKRLPASYAKGFDAAKTDATEIFCACPIWKSYGF